MIHVRSTIFFHFSLATLATRHVLEKQRSREYPNPWYLPLVEAPGEAPNKAAKKPSSVRNRFGFRNSSLPPNFFVFLMNLKLVAQRYASSQSSSFASGKKPVAMNYNGLYEIASLH